MSSQVNKENNIELFSIIDKVLKQIRIIFLITIILSCIAIVVIYNLPNKKEIFLKFDKVNSYELVFFNSINKIMEKGFVDLNSDEIFNADILFDNFISEFNTYEILSKNILKSLSNSPSFQNYTDAELDIISLTMAKNYRIVRPSPRDIKEKYLRPSIHFYGETSDISQLIHILKISIEEINQDLLKRFEQRIENMIATIKFNNYTEKKIITNELAVLKKAYLLKLESELTYLQEQSDIAREIGITGSEILNEENNNVGLPTIGMTNSSEFDEIDIIVPKNLDYLRGYIALDNQIRKIKSREHSKFEIYDPKARKLKIDLERIDMDPILSILNEFLNNASDNKFSAIDIQYDVYSERIILKKNFLYLTIPIALFFCSVLAVFLFIGYKNYLVRNNNI